ncbi:MAG: hypothetical protein ACXU9W_08035 [Thermodesulfobacteriota bacterium]
MSYRRNWIPVTVLILGSLMFIPIAQAQRQDFEAVQCYASTYNRIHNSPELMISGVEQKGITQSTHPSKLFDNWTRHSIYTVKRIGDKMGWNGFTKTLAPDGEFIMWEFSGDSQGGSDVKALYGSGKWKGVRGEYNGKRITRGKPLEPSGDQFCEKVVGWIELAK